uniref:Uncharacterized protein n=1 Tax=Arundo donax TaxID=35708 RepID=A0A0A9A238_ARUDO
MELNTYQRPELSLKPGLLVFLREGTCSLPVILIVIHLSILTSSFGAVFSWEYYGNSCAANMPVS